MAPEWGSNAYRNSHVGYFLSPNKWAQAQAPCAPLHPQVLNLSCTQRTVASTAYKLISKRTSERVIVPKLTRRCGASEVRRPLRDRRAPNNRANDPCFGAVGMSSKRQRRQEETGKGAEEPAHRTGAIERPFAEMRRVGDPGKLRRRDCPPLRQPGSGPSSWWGIRSGLRPPKPKPRANARRAPHPFEFGDNQPTSSRVCEGLPVQVALVDLVVVDDGNLRNATLREQAKRRRTSPPRPPEHDALPWLEVLPKLK